MSQVNQTYSNPVSKDLYDNLLGLAVRIADGFKIKLDFSSESIKKVESILGQLHDEYKKTKVEDGLNGVAIEFAAYIIATIRKNSDEEGIWYTDDSQFGPKSFPFVWKGSTLFPYAWCQKRLFDGKADDVYFKYQSMVLPKLSPKTKLSEEHNKMKTTYEIDGNNFSDMAGFYAEFEKKVLDTPTWGRNLDAFNDVLSGGFGTPEEGFALVWNNSEKSREVLGWPETLRFVEQKLTKCHPSNIESVKQDLEEAKQGRGQTLFEIIIGIIKGHEDVELVLR